MHYYLVWTQTNLSLPPVLPIEVEEVLGQYMNDLYQVTFLNSLHKCVFVYFYCVYLIRYRTKLVTLLRHLTANVTNQVLTLQVFVANYLLK